MAIPFLPVRTGSCTSTSCKHLLHSWGPTDPSGDKTYKRKQRLYLSEQARTLRAFVILSQLTADGRVGAQQARRHGRRHRQGTVTRCNTCNHHHRYHSQGLQLLSH